jgi:hypothetical protein
MENGQAVELEKVRATKAYRQRKAQLANREWRLDNLYWIIDENGLEIPFVRNEAQRSYNGARWSRDLILKARRLGFSTFIGILFLDNCIFRSQTSAAIIDVKLKSATDKLASIKFTYDHLPVEIKKAVPLVKANTEELEWSNGSRIAVGTSYRGAGLQMLHVSEFGKISVDSPNVAKEIKSGSFLAVPASGFIAVESTAHGTAGEFYDLVKRADARHKEGISLTALDFRLHFYGWWIKKEHRLPNNLVALSLDEKAYFAEIAPKLLSRHGVSIDADQMAWYAVQLRDLGPDDVKEEWPSIFEEAFFNSIQGAYWKGEISRARADGRIGQMVPFDPTRRVNTAWDIGEDCTAIIFHQTDGLRQRIIDYWEEVGSNLQTACGVVDEKRQLRKFVYEKHYGPHDLDHKDWAHHSKTRKETALELGVKFEVVPRVLDKGDAIEAARRFLNMTWIDSEHASLAVERFENYRKRWNKQLGVFMSDYVHDMASHGSSALEQLAMGLKPEKVKSESRPRFEEHRRTSQWAS